MKKMISYFVQLVMSVFMWVYNFVASFFRTLFQCPRLAMCMVFVMVATFAFAEDAASGVDAGKTALDGIVTSLSSYLPVVKTLSYILATAFALVGAVQAGFAMHNGEQNVVQKVWMWFGAALFVLLAAQFITAVLGTSIEG